jgi:KDO2-lipid IV(A) lauroyltransferase
MRALFKLLSHAPLWLLHGLGAFLGWVAFLGSAVYRKRFLVNVAQAGVSSSQWMAAVAEAGKLTMELPRIWLGKPVKAVWLDTALVDAAHQAGRPIIFLTPHVGSFEVAGRCYAALWGTSGHPMTALYRPARQAWLRTIMENSRQSPGLLTAPTNLGGVKQMMKALKDGHSVALLPDQVPPQGQGVWAPFFGKPAYTMTLASRLAHQSNAVVLVVWGCRLSWGRGYTVHAKPFPEVLSTDPETAAAQINRAMEEVIRHEPGQYLWGYARYKQPRNA